METMELKPSEASLANGFAVELSDKIGDLRSALGRMLSELGSPKSGQELHKMSGASRTLCWQVYRIVHTNELANEARRAPTPSSLKTLLRAVASSGVSKKTIEAVQNSAEAFQDFSKRAAGDRAAFDSMLAGVAGQESNEKILMTHRRASYRSLSHIWGVQTDLNFSCSMIRRSESGVGADNLIIYAQRGVRRLRPDSQVTLQSYHPNPNAVPGYSRVLTPLDPVAAEKYGMPVLPEFSSQPVPETQRIVLPSGWVLHNTAGREIGHDGVLNCTLGNISRGVDFYSDIDGRRLWFTSMSHIRKPVAMSIQELLVHRPSFPNAKLELMVYQHQEADLTMEAARRAMQFPVDERINNEGRADKVELPDVPRYSEMLRYAADTAGWDLREFDVYRFRMPYPIMFSGTRMFFYLD